MNGQAPYEAQAFHPILGNHVADGKLTLLEWSLRFESPECELEMPFQGLELTMQEGEESRVSFRHSNCPDWSIFTSDFSILEERAFTQRTHLRNQIEAFVRPRVWRNAVAVTVAGLFAFALISFLGIRASGYMVRVIAARIPAAWEKEYGNKLLVELKDELKESNDPALMAQLNSVTEPLTRVVKGDFQFHLVDNPIPNASAWPGGHVIVHTGLLALAASPEELAGALAHEMAHVTEKHHFRQSISDRGPYYVTQLFFRKRGLAAALATGSHLLLRQNFSRAYEREADDVGWKYLVAANINPSGEIELLKKLKAEEERLGFLGLTESPFSSHPPTQERIHRLERKWNNMKQRTGFVQFEKREQRTVE